MDAGEDSVSSHARTLHIFIVTDIFRATCGELVLLFKAWKMHGSFPFIFFSVILPGNGAAIALKAPIAQAKAALAYN